MIVSNYHPPSPDPFQGKSQSVQDLYALLLDKINLIGPVQKIIKETSVSLKNRKVFASLMIRNRSIKLVLTTAHRITSPRIMHTDRMAEKDYEHTILLESKSDIDAELLKWLGDAYLASQ